MDNMSGTSDLAPGQARPGADSGTVVAGDAADEAVGGVPVEESGLNADELSPVYIPDELQEPVQDGH